MKKKYKITLWKDWVIEAKDMLDASVHAATFHAQHPDFHMSIEEVK